MLDGLLFLVLALQELAAYECYCSCDKGDARNGKPEGQQGVAGFGKMLGGGCLLRFCGFGNRGLIAWLAGFGRGARIGLGVLGPLAEERHGAGKRIAVVPFYGAVFVGVPAVKRPTLRWVLLFSGIACSYFKIAVARGRQNISGVIGGNPLVLYACQAMSGFQGQLVGNGFFAKTRVFNNMFVFAVRILATCIIARIVVSRGFGIVKPSSDSMVTIV